MPVPKPIIGQKIQSSHPMSQNLLALYPFVDGPGSTTLTDFSGNGNHGTLVTMGASPWLSENGGALNFNGLGYVDLGALSSTLGQDDFTLILEVYMGENPSHASRHLITSSDGDTLKGISFNTINTNPFDNIYYLKKGGSGFRHESTVNTIIPQTWQRIIITRNNTATTRDISIYVDAVLNKTYSPSDLPSIDLSTPGSFWLGSLLWDSANKLIGRMSDVRIYDRGFSPLDAAADFSAPWALFTPPLRQGNNARIRPLSDRIKRRLLSERGSFAYNPELGSELYLLTRAKNLEEVYTFAEQEVRRALRPEIQKGHILEISKIRVIEKNLYTVSLEIDILGNNRELVTVPLLIS